MSAKNLVNSEMSGSFPMFTNVQEHLTLGEIGIETELAEEIQGDLERELKMNVGINLIKTIDVKMLKDYEMGKVESIQQYLQELKRAVDALDQYKFIIPSEPFTRLNDVKNGKPIYFMPPFEITYSAYKEMAQRFDRPVIGINWTKDMNKIETFKDFKQYIMNLMKKLEPNGQLDLVGYLDGKEAVSKLLLKGMVSKAVIIDIITDKRIQKEDLTDEYLTEMVFGFLSYRFPGTFQNKVTRAIKNEPDINSKIRKIVSELKEIAGKGMIANDLVEIIQILIKRAKYNSKYRSKKISKIPDSLWNKTDEKLTKIMARQLFIEFTDFEDENEENEGTINLNTNADKNKSDEIFSIEALNSEHSITSELIANKIIKSFK